MRAPASLVGDDNTGVFTEWEPVKKIAQQGTKQQRAAMAGNYKNFDTAAEALAFANSPKKQEKQEKQEEHHHPLSLNGQYRSLGTTSQYRGTPGSQPPASSFCSAATTVCFHTIRT